LSVVPLKIGKITVNRGKRTGKRRLFAKSQHFTGQILLRTGTNTQEGDYQKIATLKTLDYLKQRAERGDESHALKVLKQSSSEPPLASDRVH